MQRMPRTATAQAVLNLDEPDRNYVFLSASLERWFISAQRVLPWREQYEPYAIWVSEIMLQQTRVDVVVDRFVEFMRRFPNAVALAGAQEDEVLAAWSGLGYYRRARMLLQGSREVVRQHAGLLPPDVVSLEKISGIGRYTAGAISSIAFNLPAPIVDGNVARVLARLFLLDAPFGNRQLIAEQWRISAALVSAAKSPRMLNQSLMELGALICRPRQPRCGECPVRQLCGAAAENLTDQIPRLRARQKMREMTVPIFWIEDESGRVLLVREPGALMHGMYHLPYSDNPLFGKGLALVSSARIGSFQHTITNRQIEFEVHSSRWNENEVADGHYEGIWIRESELASYAHPSYVEKAVRLVRSR